MAKIKQKKSNKVRNWIIIIVCYLLVSFYFIEKIYDRKVVPNNIKQNTAYAIATIEHYSWSYRTGTSLIVSFRAGDELIVDRARYWQRDEKQKIKEGEKYIVTYNSKNPREFILLCTLPVTDCSDFITKKKKLEKYPLDLTFE